MSRLLNFARRLGIVALAVIVAAMLLRPQISSALVVRGDELQLRGQGVHSLEIYARALAFDPTNVTAADRYAFAAVLGHDASAERKCVLISTNALLVNPRDSTLRYDRALCEHRLDAFAAAAADFAIVGIDRHDARALLFAALDLRRIRSPQARKLLRMAAAQHPAFRPAVRDLAESAAWNT